MEDQIYVQLFRNFSVVYKGDEIIRQLVKSPKSISVLKYLILNRGRSVPVGELIEIFWEEEGGSNPENALKTLISRVRKALSAEHPELRSCIVTEQSTYRWGPDIPCEVDAFIFEERCLPLLAQNERGPDWRALCSTAVDMYKGNLDASFVTDEWIKGRGLYYQELYLKLVYSYVNRLKEDGDYETVINICRAALNIEAFDENLNLELMYALKETNQNNAALLHYRHSTDMYYKYLGMDPSDKMLEFYKQLIKADLSVKENLGAIRDKLVHEKLDNQAFLCDYSIFKDIYQLQLRNVERWGVQMFLALIMVEHVEDDGEFNPFILDRIMRDLLEILMRSLRKGDIVTRYSSSQYAVLLQMTSVKDGEIVIDRIRKSFYESIQEPYAKLIFQVGHISDPA